MVTIFVSRDGRTEKVEHLDPEWLKPDSRIAVWVDLQSPTAEEAALLRDQFHFHDLAIEDAMSDLQDPKVEEYNGYLYLILHGINFKAAQHKFATHDVDFFLGRNYLVTIRDEHTRAIPIVQDVCVRNGRVLSEGLPALLHRLVDTLVDHYRPEIEKLEVKLDALEKEVFELPTRNFVKKILDLKKDIVSLRRVALPQRDVVNRLARREFTIIDTEIAYRFRDVYDHLVRITDEALIFQDRVTGILEAHLSSVSNRMNEVMKVLTVIATIFMPLSVLTGAFGMNVVLPHFPGGELAQFWWVTGIMTALTGVMLWLFRRSGWI